MGAVNKFTATARQAFQMAFEGIGGVAKLQEWANANQTDFYKIYAKLIPIDLTVNGKGQHVINIIRFADHPEIATEMKSLQKSDLQVINYEQSPEILVKE